MRHLVVDELCSEEKKQIEKYLEAETEKGPVEGAYWLTLPAPLLTACPQEGHEQCGPFQFCIELQRTAVLFELLVRSRATLHCSCISYATLAQREFLFAFVDTMLLKLGVKA